jgi:hypothetical protein
MAAINSIYHQGILEYVDHEVGDDASPTAKGDAFCQWCLENIFDLSRDQALDATENAGSYDHGIDALILDDEKLIVVQTKFEQSHDWSEVTKFYYDMQRIRNKKVRESEVSDGTHRNITMILDAYEHNWEVKYYYITSIQFTETDLSKINSMDDYGTVFFFYDLSSIVLSIESKREGLPASVDGHWFSLGLASTQILKLDDDTGVVGVVAVGLTDMHDFVAQGGNNADGLFVSNVRQYLKGSQINNGIRETLKKAPEQFGLYNNGITIVCEDFEDQHSTVRIKTPQIVNGCQTARCIFDFLSNIPKEERYTVPGYVLVRIIKGASKDQFSNITRFTNTQNAVRGKDFLSLEDLQQKLHTKFKKLHYYYEIQRGSFTSLKKSQRADYTGVPQLSYLVDRRFRNVIPALEAIQAYAAGYKELAAVAYANPNEFAPHQTHYNVVFDTNLTPDPKLFLYPFLVREWANKTGYGRGGLGGWHAHAALLFVHGYYVLALRALNVLGLLDTFEMQPDKVATVIWDRIFFDSVVNESLLSLTEDVLDRFFSDSKVADVIGQDVRKFLRSQVELNRYIPILRQKAETVLNQAKNRKVLESLFQILEPTD